ncbi:MAG TPA: hypothetical protein VMV59_08405 [Candidatus Dormibacteraeota bacterium]|nr:hypothetical protein [Candidatus Dormibacteraeota bacterium]
MATGKMMTDAEFDAALDAILSELDVLHAKMDALTKRREATDARLDRAERKRGRKDAQRAADVEMEKPSNDDSPEIWHAWQARESRRIGHEARKKDERNGVKFREGGKIADGATDELVDGIRTRVRAESRTDSATLEQFEDAQLRAQSAADPWGFDVDRWTQNEKLTDYRLRLLQPFKKHSPEWKGANLREIAQAGALTSVEDSIFQSAKKAATDDAAFKNTLRRMDVKDETGRKQTKFYGSPEVTWSPFKMAPRRVLGFHTRFERGTPSGTPKMPGA